MHYHDLEMARNSAKLGLNYFGLNQLYQKAFDEVLDEISKLERNLQENSTDEKKEVLQGEQTSEGYDIDSRLC
jgi:hypothetical protein